MILTRFTVRSMRVFRAAGARESLSWKEQPTFRACFVGRSLWPAWVVVRHMLRLAGHFKVFNSVIQFVSVSMMHNLLRERFQFASKMLLHYVAVLVDLLAVYVNHLVAVDDGASTLRGKDSHVRVAMPLVSFVVGATISRTATLSPPTGFRAICSLTRNVKRRCFAFLSSITFQHLVSPLRKALYHQSPSFC